MIQKSKLVVFILCCVALASAASAIGIHLLRTNNATDNTNNSKVLTDTERIAHIKSTVAAIDRKPNYQERILNNEQFLDHMTDGGGQLIGYFDGGTIVKIVERLGLSYGVMTYTYYLTNEALILVEEQEDHFVESAATGDLDYSNIVTSFHGYYYFDNGIFIDKQTTGAKRFNDNVTDNSETKFVTMAQQNIRLLKAQ